MKFYLTKNLTKNFFFNNLKTYLLKKRGFNTTGKKVFFRYQQHKLRISYKLQSFYWAKSPGLIVNTFFIRYHFKIVSLILFKTGFLALYPINSYLNLFNFFFLNSQELPNNLKKNTNIFFLFFLKPNQYIINIAMNKIKYYLIASTMHSKAKCIFRSKTYAYMLTELPSRRRLYLSYFLVCLLYVKQQHFHIRYLNNYFGFWGIYGYKGRVRGVAKNPVDHPHGGRTKAIKYQRTPWGLTAKFK